MKFRLPIVLSTLVLVLSLPVFAQQELIDKIFSDKGVDFRSQVVLEDTLAEENYYSMEDYGAIYESRFGLEDFQCFMVYSLKSTNKKGLIVVGTNNSVYSDAVADSIYFLQHKDYEVEEVYNDEGYYVYATHYKSALFFFDMPGSKDEYYVVSTASDKHILTRGGVVEKDIFKAVNFTENLTPEGSTYVTAVYANIRTNQLVNSTVLNEQITINEVYAYHYDYYGEYDYYYSYEQPEMDYSVPYFETRLNYEPMEVIYLKSGDTISEVLSYSFASADPMAYNKRALSDDMNGVWKNNNEELIIVDGDDLWSYYGVFIASIDSYKELFETGRKDWSSILQSLNLSTENKKALEDGWKGSKSNVGFIKMTSFVTLDQYKDFYIFNDEILARILFKYDYNSKSEIVQIDFYDKQKVYEAFGSSKYDNYTYTTTLLDADGNALDLWNAGVEYYYNYNMAVADRNIDKDGNLILTNESLGNIQFMAYTGGNNYIGKVKYQWIGNENFSDGGTTMVSIKSMPYQIKDASGKVLVDDVFSMYTTNVQGFNLYQVYNSNNKAGVLGPDGSWMVKQEWDAVTVTGPSSSYGYDGYGSIGLPVFFLVTRGEKYGALDSKGNWVVPMGHDYIEICSGHLIANKDAKISIYSFDGKLLMSGLDGFGGGYYGYATDCYSFDMTSMGNRILIKNNLYGMVDEKFNQVVPFEYSSITALPGSNNFIVAKEDGKYGMISGKNEILLDFEYDVIIPFDYNQTRLIASKDGNQGVIDRNGNVIIPFQYYSITPSSDWYSNMIYISDPDYRTNIIDTNGNSVIQASCSYLYYYPGYDMFYCAGTEGTFDFYNRSGELMYSKIATYVDPYSAYDYVQILQMGDYENPTFGAFDLTSGYDLMPCEFESLYPFWINEQIFFAAVKKGKLGIYSIDGNMLVKHKGMYLDNYYYSDGYDGSDFGYFVEISNKKGKSKVIRLEW